MVEHYLKELHPNIERIVAARCGLIIEYKLNANKTDDHYKDVFELLSRDAWTRQDIIYSLYVYFDDKDRFVLEGTLRKTRTTFAYNMSSSVLGNEDIFGRFARYDFDRLTLTDYNGIDVLFQVIDDASPAPQPRGKFAELDLLGHQFPVKSEPVRSHDDNYYTVRIGTETPAP